MDKSPRYIQLETRIKLLHSRFIGENASAIGTYSDEAKDLARAYRVLVHAEVESYLRDRVDEVVRFAVQLWRDTRVAHPVVVSMLAW